MTALYHRTTPTAATTILRDGFRDKPHSVLPVEGIWLSDRPFDYGGVLLAVEFDNLDCLTDYEVYEIDDSGPRADGPGFYREWCIPAAVIHRLGTVRRATKAEDQLGLGCRLPGHRSALDGKHAFLGRYLPASP